MERPFSVMEDFELDNPDRLYFTHFLTKAYQVFLAGGDDYTEMEHELESESDRQNDTTLQEIERLEEENARLEREMHDLHVSQPPLQALQQEREILMSDKTKFKDYIARLDSKRARVADSNIKLAQMLKEAESALEEMGQEKAQLQGQVDAQDISAADVEKMNSEHEALIKSLDIATTQLHDVSTQVFERERLAQHKLDSLDKAIQTFNTLAYTIGVVPASAPRAKGISFELDFSNPEDSEKSWFATRANDLLSIDLRGKVKPALSRLRQDLGTEVHQHKDTSIRLTEFLEQANESIFDKERELGDLEAKLGSVIEQCNELKHTMDIETSESSAQAEQLERDLATMRNSARNGLIQLDQKAQSVSIEFDRLEHSSNEAREGLIRDVVKTLDDMIQFKVHIQTNLESLDAEANEMTTQGTRAAAGGA